MSTATIDNIDTYVNDISKYNLISRNEERRLAALTRSGDPETARAARDRLVCANLRLVVKIAHEFKQYDLPLSDLVAEGNIGLLKAAGKFDPANGAKFSVYAAWWIKQAMRVAVAERTRTVRIPRNSGIRIVRLNKARARWIAEHNEEPTAADLAALLDMREDVVERLLSTPGYAVSMNAHLDDDDDAPTYEAMLSSDMADDHPGKEERAALVYSAMNSLSDLDRELVNGVYWTSGKADMPALAMRVGLSVGAATSRLALAMARLRDVLSATAPDSLLSPA